MTERKVLRHVVAFQQTLDDTGIFTKSIFVPFVPDEVKVKQIGFYDTGGTPGCFSLNCDSLAGQAGSIFGFFIDSIVSFSGITYQLRESPNGSHTFRVMEDGDVSDSLDTGSLNVHLEFRKYM
jgi:hypothetical protein